MPPRVTLHNQPSAHAALKGKSAITAPILAAEDIDIASDETDELAEDTVDSLDDPNSLQPQWETLSASASASASASGNKLVKKPRQKPPAVRTPGQPLLSMTRIETIVNADPTTGPLSKEAVLIVALAAEDFIRRFTRVAQSRSKHEHRAITTYNDFADTVHNFPEFDFLKDMIPRAISLRQALAEREHAIRRRDALLNGIDPDSPEAMKRRIEPETNTNVKLVNGKDTHRSSEPPENEDTASARTDRQKAKKPRLNHTEGVQAKQQEGRTNRKVSKAGNLGRGTKNSTPDSSNSNTSAGVKIRIRPPQSKQSPPSDPPLDETPALHDESLQDVPPSNSDESKSIDHENSSKKLPGKNPVSSTTVGSDRAPLWTSVPLPPPPSPRGQRNTENGRHGRGRGSKTGTDVEAALKVKNATQHHPPHNKEKTPVNLRELVATNGQNPGRTIYSQR